MYALDNRPSLLKRRIYSLLWHVSRLSTNPLNQTTTSKQPQRQISNKACDTVSFRTLHPPPEVGTQPDSSVRARASSFSSLVAYRIKRLYALSQGRPSSVVVVVSVSNSGTGAVAGAARSLDMSDVGFLVSRVRSLQGDDGVG